MAFQFGSKVASATESMNNFAFGIVLPSKKTLRMKGNHPPGILTSAWENIARLCPVCE